MTRYYTAAVLIFKNDLNGKYLENKVPDISEKLENINLKISKSACIKENDVEDSIRNALKQFDYTFLIINSIDSSNLTNISSSLSKVFNQKLVEKRNFVGNSRSVRILEHFKILSDDDIDQRDLVLYMQGLFILNVHENMKSLMDIITSHLNRRIKRKQFRRCLYFNSQVDIHNIRRISDSNVEMDLTKEKTFLKLIISSSNMEALTTFENTIRNLFREFIVKTEEATDIAKCVYQYNYYYVKNAINTIEECFRRYKPQDVFLAFNGGKDCTVLLHLTLAVLKRNYQDQLKLLCLYVQSTDPFEELDLFVDQCKQYYDLELMVQRKSIKESLECILEAKPNIKVCLMGTRRDDPFANEFQTFQMTDPNWPQVMRVSPLLDWHYSDIWDYLLDLQVPYCSLYDKGYTSIGGRSNTKPNPSLNFYDPLKNTQVHLPAYKLLDASKERNGRNF